MTQELLAALLALLAAMGQSTATLQQQVQQLTEALASLGAASPTAPVVTVTTGAELQAAINTAPAGTTIKLAPGTYTGYFVLRNRPGTEITTITTDGSIPDGRMQPTVPLAKLAAPGIGCVIRTEPGASRYALVGLEIAEVAGGTASVCLGSNTETTAAEFPSDITLDRVRLIAQGTQVRGVMAIGANVTIRDSYIAGIKAIGQDSQAIWCNGPGPYLIENNYLEAAGENVMCGGADPKMPGMVPSDITIRGNHLAKDLAWRGAGYTVKNILELKNARRVSITGNLLEHVWVQAQTGYAVLFTPRNQSGTCPWCVVEDVTFEHNVVRGMAGGIQLLGTDNEKPSQTTARITIRRNVFEDFGSAWGSGGYWLSIGAGAQDVTIDHNTLVSSGARGVIVAYGAPMSNFVFTNNVAKHDTYGIFGSGFGSGTPALAHYFPGATITRNVLAGGSARAYPAGNLFPSVADFLAHFVNPAGGDYTLKAGTDWAAAGTDGQDLGR